MKVYVWPDDEIVTEEELECEGDNIDSYIIMLGISDDFKIVEVPDDEADSEENIYEYLKKHEVI